MLICILAVVTILSGCTSVSRDEKVLSDANPLTKEQAISVATKSSPMKIVETTDLTPPGPRMWVIHGRDESGRKLAVWVWKGDKPEGYIYLDKGVSSAVDAVATAKAAGFSPLNSEPALIRPANPAWYVFIHSNQDAGGQSYVIVEQATGAVVDPANE
jgi:uncharacterized protein YpmB